MSRRDTLLVLISQAHANGFDFRGWFLGNISAEWPGTDEAITYVDSEGRYFALLFSHDFVRAFWKKGAQMNFIVPSSTYSRMNGKGQVETINRKPFTRRTIKADVWKYHLREMATAEDPLRYMKRFMPNHQDFQSTSGEPDSLPAVG